jgi:hypothetical protein
MSGATLQIGAATVRDQTVVMRPYPAEVPEMDCIIGLGPLKAYVVEFDYGTPELRLFDAKSFKPSEDAATISFRIDRSIPIADVSVTFEDGYKVTASMALDTGAGFYAGVLMPRFVQEHRVMEYVDKTARRPDRPSGTGGELSILSTRPSKLGLGSIEMNGPVVGMIETESAGIFWDGLLGAGFFRRFTAAFDLSRGQLHLMPTSASGNPQVFDASGVGFRRNVGDGTYAVDMVLRATPAAAAGLQEGDVLESIDGIAAKKLDPIEIAQRLSRAGQPCELSLQRGGDVRRVTLHLMKRL